MQENNQLPYNTNEIAENPKLTEAKKRLKNYCEIHKILLPEIQKILCESNIIGTRFFQLQLIKLADNAAKLYNNTSALYNEQLTRLENMKKELEEEKAKNNYLTKQLSSTVSYPISFATLGKHSFHKPADSFSETIEKVDLTTSDDEVEVIVSGQVLNSNKRGASSCDETPSKRYRQRDL